jgi:tripartite-type tricarboxylate transporter receptor subunit TctC
LAGELLKSMANVELVPVPYRGCTPAAADVAGGQVPIGIIPYGTARSFMDSGRMRPLVQTGAKRLSLMPDIPTAAESGFPGYAVDQWWGLFAAAKTPRDTLDKLNADIKSVVEMESVNKQLVDQGISPVLMAHDEFTKFLNDDIERWSKLAKARDLKP